MQLYSAFVFLIVFVANLTSGVLYKHALSLSSNVLSGRRAFTPDLCSKKFGFVGSQKETCRNNYQLMPDVIRGHLIANEECRAQFRRHRWNCTGHNVHFRTKKKRRKSYMQRLMQKGIRESAYIHAVTAAGVAHAVTKACSSGAYQNCGCDRSIYDYPKKPDFKWSGCSDNIHFGSAFSIAFLDVRHKRRIRRNMKLGLTNLHNNNAGRKAVENKMKIECKCHGVSASCDLKTCWRALPRFSDVGTHLRQKFDEALMVDLVNNRLTPKYEVSRQIKDDDLVYVSASPSFCERDPRHGSLGTKDRECNATSSEAMDSCHKLCCKRGFSQSTIMKTEDCNCKFFWCCQVKCDKCQKVVTISKCL